MSARTAPQEYFAQRAATEHARASQAADVRARRAHEELAREYEARAIGGVAND